MHRRVLGRIGISCSGVTQSATAFDNSNGNKWRTKVRRYEFKIVEEKTRPSRSDLTAS